MPILGPSPTRIGLVGPQYDSPGSTKVWTIVGTAINGAGDGAAGAIVKLFDTATDMLQAQTVSGAGGAFTFVVPNNSLGYWLLAYLPGSPDLFAASVNTIGPS